jgi:Domain of unknown function (DUF6305)
MTGILDHISRRNSFWALAGALATTIVWHGLLAAQDGAKPSTPVLVTSIGQSLDAFQVQLAVKRAGVAFEYDAHAEPPALANAKTLFLAVGASLKGFGDAGITIKDELARTTHLLDEARKRGIYIVVLHMGGEERRDALSNQLIELAAPAANRLIIRNDSNADGVFTKIATAGKIPLTVLENTVALRETLKEMFPSGS